MNMIDLDRGMIGCFGIVGGSIAAATGAALALKGSGRIATAFFGDGATNQAYFFECLNFAKVLSLPALFVCENNGYGEYTPAEAVTAGTITARAEAMEIPTVAVDGMDVWAVREAAVEAVERVRAEGTPTFVEARTYRFVGHSRSDPGKYRPEGELERWQERDPLLIAERRLVEEHGVSPEAVQEVATDVERTLGEVERAALDAPFPEPAVFAEFKE
jgi:TPP-dependent pyruvate/acetoin dehydrogenase alpha subunit